MRTTSLVSYKGHVYYWDSIFGTGSRYGRKALLAPVGGGDVIAVPVRLLRVLPGPGMRTTWGCS